MRRIWKISLVLLVLFVIIDFLVVRGGGEGLMGFKMPGLFSIFGFIACVLLVLVSKWIGHHWLQRPEGYYEKKGKNE